MAPGPFFIKDVLDGDKAKVKPLEVFRPLGTVGVLNTSLMVPMDSPLKLPKILLIIIKQILIKKRGKDRQCGVIYFRWTCFFTS